MFLYDYIWEKYEYILNNPSKIKTYLWWKNVEIDHDMKEMDILYEHFKFCSPFVIKIMNKDNMSCGKCPWYRLCPGCILDPFKQEDLIIKPNVLYF